ncbi:MAG: malto-oligosyltrehalose trehalohydrolase [Bdellovibrionota bacterium]
MFKGRRLPIGAEYVPDEGVHFRVWAPRCQEVDVVLEDSQIFPLHAEQEGYFSGFVGEAKPDMRYRFRLDRGQQFPDPASRFQPLGPHGPSQIVDRTRFKWTDLGWRGKALRGQVVYEMHIGTFTAAGTWNAAEEELPALRDLGITVLEIMPVADFPGAFNWGYDGVNLFAPSRVYGSPDDFRRFVDRAHALELAVILDVVYNHVGPDGNYLQAFSKDYVTDRYVNEWGDALNFDGENSSGSREFFASNAAYWIDEFHLDGLRLDATQQIFDSSPSATHIVTEIGARARAAAQGRQIIIVAENEPQLPKLVRPVTRGGYGLDGLWNDDFHHSAKVRLTGRREAYYSDYTGSPEELIAAVKYGFLSQGEYYPWQKQRRGAPAFDLPPEAFITYLENHDQVANSARGDRLVSRTSPGRLRAMTALLLLSPQTPMLFQGQEYGSDRPFLFFADHNDELAPLVAEGRRKFLSQFPSVEVDDINSALAEPSSPDTFERCKLTHARENNPWFTFHRDLLRMRREDPVIASQLGRSEPGVWIDGARLSNDAFALRYFGGERGHRLLLVNFGADLELSSALLPFLAPPEGETWEVKWQSERLAYGGTGMGNPAPDDGWYLAAESAVILAPVKTQIKNEKA